MRVFREPVDIFQGNQGTSFLSLRKKISIQNFVN